MLVLASTSPPRTPIQAFPAATLSQKIVGTFWAPRRLGMGTLFASARKSNKSIFLDVCGIIVLFVGLIIYKGFSCAIKAI